MDPIKQRITKSRAVRLVLVVAACSAAAGGVAAGDALTPDDQVRKAVQEVTGAAPRSAADAGAVNDVAADVSGVDAEATAAEKAPLPPDLKNYRDPTPDVGSASDIAAVKRDIVLDLDQDAEIMRPHDVPSDLQSQLGEVYAASVLEAVTGETARAMQGAAEDPNYPAYAEHRFAVTEWQGVQATPTGAVATLLGYDSWRNVGQTTFVDDPVNQWQIVLANEGGRWKLVDQAAFDPAERRANDSSQQFPDGLPRMP
jgi:hypothetical protein